jgi:hypothetical protein
MKSGSRSSSFAYNDDGIVINDNGSGIYECNFKCSCNVNLCPNRVVGKGPCLPLEVFRCVPSGKGWGVQCKIDIPPGTFIADYIGEVLDEQVADKRGVMYGDEYLFTLDAYGRSRGCQRLHDLGLKSSQQFDREEYYLPMKEENKSISCNHSTSSLDMNVFKVPVFESYAYVDSLRNILGNEVVNSILKSNSVKLDATSDRVYLLGNTSIQRQNMKSRAVCAAPVATAGKRKKTSTTKDKDGVSKAKKSKKNGAEAEEGDILGEVAENGCLTDEAGRVYREYNQALDEGNMIKRSRVLAQKEAR